MRGLLVFLHKYVGLILGVLLSITGLSGSLIVFDRELDEFLDPATADFAPAATLAPFDVAVANATAAVNNGTAPTRLMVGRHAGAPHIVRFPTPPGAIGPIEVSVDPGSGEALKVRHWGEYPVTWIYRLHLNFLGGERGEILVGIMGFCFLFFCLSGVIIWWPRTGKWRRALTIRRRTDSFRLNYDLHKVFGLYFLPVFIVLSITGIEIVWHEPFERVVAAVLPVQEEPDPVSAPSTGSEPLTMDQVAARARAVFPDSRISRLYRPSAPEGAWEVTFIHPGENWREYGASSVYIDQYSGEVLEVWDARELSAGSTLLTWMFPLHNGDALGLAGRIVVFIAGLLPAVLFGTGVTMWWLKRRRRQREARLVSLLAD